MRRTRRTFVRSARLQKFYPKAFPENTFVDPVYESEWEGRLVNPKRAWSASDYDRRRVLKELFPKTFGNIDKDTNLNNREYENQYNAWRD